MTDDTELGQRITHLETRDDGFEVEIVLASGDRVQLRGGVTEATLAQVFTALRDGRC